MTPKPSVVAFGGGHGLAASLTALRMVCDRITAVVTVADDGGSSGRLRREFGVLPPGDLRMALAALCDDSPWGRTWADVLQHRFSSGGTLDNHAMGNLLIVALWDLLGDSVEGLDWVGRLVRAHGRVLPMASIPLDIEALVRRRSPGVPDELTKVRGQAAVATARGEVLSVSLVPPDPPARPETVAAVREADWVVLGPGSWFSSVLPHLLVPELAAAIGETSARRCVTLNLAPQAGETDGYTALEHLEVLAAHAPGLRLDVVIADPSSVDDEPALAKLTDSLGGTLCIRPVREAPGVARHDPDALAEAYRLVFGC